VARWGEFQDSSVEEARTLEHRRLTELAGTGPELSAVRRLAIPAGDREIPAVAYRPTGQPAPGVLVWLHGGGWVVGTLEGTDFQARVLARASGCVVISVDYRLAPEHRFPAAAEDALAAVVWAEANAESLGAARRRVAVGGDSAGGNLAAATTLLARDRGGPKIAFQLLVYPATCREPVGSSRERYADGYWLTAAAMEWFWDRYLADDEAAASPYASPLLAESLAGLPPALMVLAEYDVLHDEGQRYAERLRHASVPVTLRRHEGMVHGFIGCGGIVGQASEALREAGQAVRAGLVEPRST
jgi:acetyl esterase